MEWSNSAGAHKRRLVVRQSASGERAVIELWSGAHTGAGMLMPPDEVLEVVECLLDIHEDITDAPF